MLPSRYEQFAKLRTQFRAEQKRRKSSVNGVDSRFEWARGWADRPVEFIGEVMGPAWWTDDWLAWRAFVRAIWGQPLGHDELAIYKECTGRSDPPFDRVREVWAPIGRRGGKSRCFAYVAVHLVCCYDYSDCLVPGERGVVPILAESKDRAQQTFGYIKAALRHHRLAPMVERVLAEEVELAGGLAIRVTTASINAVRSRTVISAIGDEIAFWPKDESANPDREILNALRPAMLTVPDSVFFGLSSPYARRGLLYERFSEYWGKDDPRVLVWRASTERMHPSVDANEIATAYEEDPASAAAEYGAEFRSDVAAYVSREAMRAVTVDGRYELEPARGIEYRAFVDPSGGLADSMTLAIAHKEGDIGVLDLLREARPPFSPDSVAAEFSEDMHRYNVVNVVGDRYAGEWPRERFAVRGISYEVSEQVKAEIYQSWLPLINSQRLQLLDDKRLMAQACSLERRTSRMGRDAIDHPPKAHDDVVNAAAGALVLACGDRYPAMWNSKDMLVIA